MIRPFQALHLIARRVGLASPAVVERARDIQMAGRVVAHDLSNVMLAIDGNVARARMHLGDEVPPEAEAALRAIADAVRHGREMTRQLRSRQPFELPELRACDLRSLADEGAALQRMRAVAAGVMIETEGPPGISVAADRTQIIRVLMNLIGNAVRACDRGSTIRIEYGTDGEGAFLRVSDDGIGMTPEQLERAFDPRFSTKTEGGAGLGLAISYLIVDAHGGHLSLGSKPGEGTVALIRLPASARRFLPADAGPLLLVIEDDEARDRCAAGYRALGGEVVEVASAAELAEVLADSPPEWELVIRTPKPALLAPIRQRLAGGAEVLVGRRRAALRGIEKCRLSDELARELAALARPSPIRA